MSFSVGIIGLPNVGKSTLFKALTKSPVAISNYPFTTIDPNVGIVQIPDERLEKLAHILKPEKVTPTIIEFVDIAGLVKNAHKGEGLGNQFLARIREVDVIIHIVRDFEDERVIHVENTVDPTRDIEIIRTELAMKDIETLEKHIEKLSKDIKGGDKKAVEEKEIAKKICDALNENRALDTVEEKEVLAHLNLLSLKKVVAVYNTTAGDLPSAPSPSSLCLNLKLEEELTELSPKEREELGEKPQLPRLIKLCYETLELITFFTVKGGKELRAWTLKKGESAHSAAFKVHTDFGEKFIKADVISWETLLETNSWTHAREQGRIKTEGKKYLVNDGDVIEFRI